MEVVAVYNFSMGFSSAAPPAVSPRPKLGCFLRCVSDSRGDIVVLQADRKLL